MNKSISFLFLAFFTFFSLSASSSAAYIPGTCLSLTATGLTYDSYDQYTYGQVSVLQDFLIWKGLLMTDDGRSTGYYGMKTLAAVRAYQRANGIQTTGTTGPLTKAAIVRETCTVGTGSQTGTYQQPTGTSPAYTSPYTLPTYTYNPTNNSTNDPFSYYNNPNTYGSTIPTCSIFTNKSAYSLGETIVASYTSSNASYATWVYSPGITVNTANIPASGTSQFIASPQGWQTITLRVYNASSVGSCSKTISISSTGTLPNQVVTTPNTTTGSQTAVTPVVPATTMPVLPAEPLPTAPTVTASLKKATLSYLEQWGELTWTASPDSLCERFKTVGGITDFAGTTTTSGTYKFMGDETTTYTVTCHRFATGASGNLLKSSTSKQVTVTVPQTAGILRMRAGKGLGTFEAGESYATKELALAECNYEFAELMKVSSTSMTCTWNSQLIFSHRGTVPLPKFVINHTNVAYYPSPENTPKLVVGDTSEILGRFNIRSVNETSGATITRLGFKVPTSVKSLTVLGVTAQAVDGVVNMTGLSIPVPKGGVGLHFNVTGKLNCVGSASGCVPANSDVYVTLDTFGYTYTFDTELGGIKTVTGGSNDISNNKSETYKLVTARPKITVTALSTVRLENASGKIGGFSIKAEGSGPISIVQIPVTITQTGTGSISPSSVELRNADGTTAIQGATHLSGSGIFVLTPPKTIAAGATETFTVYASTTGVTGVSGSNTIKFSLGNKNSLLWDDVTGNLLNQTGAMLHDYPATASSTMLLTQNQTNSQILGVNTQCVDLPYNMFRGYESNFVTNLQNFLVSHGFLSDSPTGFYGDKTVTAVKEYQGSKGLPVTGMVYDFTRASIKADSCQ